jgi:hypothetical protein
LKIPALRKAAMIPPRKPKNTTLPITWTRREWSKIDGVCRIYLGDFQAMSVMARTARETTRMMIG